MEDSATEGWVSRVRGRVGITGVGITSSAATPLGVRRADPLVTRTPPGGVTHIPGSLSQNRTPSLWGFTLHVE